MVLRMEMLWFSGKLTEGHHQPSQPSQVTHMFFERTLDLLRNRPKQVSWYSWSCFHIQIHSFKLYYCHLFKPPTTDLHHKYEDSRLQKEKRVHLKQKTIIKDKCKMNATYLVFVHEKMLILISHYLLFVLLRSPSYWFSFHHNSRHIFFN